jgi:hypothetical protein
MLLMSLLVMAKVVVGFAGVRIAHHIDDMLILCRPSCHPVQLCVVRRLAVVQVSVVAAVLSPLSASMRRQRRISGDPSVTPGRGVEGAMREGGASALALEWRRDWPWVSAEGKAEVASAASRGRSRDECRCWYVVKTMKT